MPRPKSPRERQRRDLERKAASRAPYERILIVSEGRKTEPLYFEEIRVERRLHTAYVHVRFSELGTAPLQVVEYARQLFEDGDPHKPIPRRAFDRVYAVFDRDEHPSYFDALDRAKSLDGKLRNDEKQPVRFSAVASIPCFELWLLLHFEDVMSPLHRDETLQRLKAHLPSYEKGTRGTFSMTKANLDVATVRARRLASRTSVRLAPEPFTDVVELVARLLSLGK